MAWYDENPDELASLEDLLQYGQSLRPLPQRTADLTGVAGAPVRPESRPPAPNVAAALRESGGMVNPGGASKVWGRGNVAQPVPGPEPVEPFGTPDEAASALRSWNKARYGGEGTFGGAGAAALNQAPATLESLLRTAGVQAQQAPQRIPGFASMSPMQQQAAIDEIYQGLLAPHYRARQSAEEAALTVDELNRKNEERTSTQRMLESVLEMEPGALGGVPGGMEGKSPIDIAMKGKADKRAEAAGERADRRLEAMLQNQQFNQQRRMAQPPNPAAVRQLATRILMQNGYQVRNVAGNPTVMKGNTEADPKLYAQAEAQAEAMLQSRGGMGGGNMLTGAVEAPEMDPSVQSHPAVRKMNQIVREANTTGMKSPMMDVYERSYNKFIKSGVPAQQAMIFASMAATGEF